MLLAIHETGELKPQVLQAADKIELLRRIITDQEQREVGYDEAQEIGNSLIEFFQLLAEDTGDEPDN